MAEVDVVVVGAGLMGAATAWAAARRGMSVALYEARGAGHRAGSSHGSARIFRRAYPDALYVRMTGLAGELWRELERQSGRPLLRTTGGLDHGRRRGAAGIVERLTAAGVPAELVPAAEAARRWPGLAFDGPVAFHAEAGVIDADHAVAAMTAAATAAGARCSFGTPVAAVEPSGAGARLLLASGEAVSARRVVVAAGAWLPDLLGAVVALPPLVVTQQQVFHFRPAGPGGEWPIFVYKGDDISAYGLPGGRDGGPGGAMKVAEHDAGTVTTADDRTASIDPAARQRVVDLVRRRMPGLVAEPFAEASCLYTSTANEDFLLDRVGPIVVCSPCSGHGAKFAPLIGELAADLAQDRPGHDHRFTLAAHGVPTSGSPSASR